ncbi:aminodeoxychorismate lyase [Corynebacterium sp. CNCTC7651]|uniref:aminodeoxychorismate lyase n=1 Tax=Corynebacterium sp. CNCTC7651 TaxID=2815361 RepID=UPI001F1E5AB8|nr:aminodeoxychorismate lyase [Corynebacterium sp. CNCTC7651]UIZ91835.1 aminodeoxychorismate lyase [Corynebacterium sp. CNCTC7651]
MGQSLLPPEPVIYLVESFGGPIRRQNPNMPHVFWDDAAVTRGDGVFETILVRGGRALNLDKHVARFIRSAAALALPEPNAAQWVAATEEAVADYCREHLRIDDPSNPPEAKCVWTMTRGRETTGVPTAWLTIRPIGQEVLRQREEGVAVVTTPRGLSVAADVPWMAVEAKTLNYAASMAALRWARAQGFDDVIYTEPAADRADGADGADLAERVLEGATSTVVMVKKGGRLRTPAPGPGILPGTTQAALFDFASERGWKCKAKDIYVNELEKAESVWLVSSTRICARVTRLNDRELPAPANEAEVRELITAALEA